MKLIEFGEDKEKAQDRLGMLHSVAYEGLAPADQSLSRKLKKIQERLDELLEDPPSSFALDEEWVELLKARVFGAHIQWSAKANTRALDIFDVLKAAVEWKPEIVKKEAEDAA